MNALGSPPALLLWLCLALYLPGLALLPPVDRDEARFAQATRQMLESGDFVEPRFQEEGRYKKPIGIYWLQAATVGFLGTPGAIAAYRLPSLAGAILAVLATYWIGSRLFGHAVGFLAGGLLAASAAMVVEAMLATTDAVLLAAVVAAEGCLASVFLARRRGERPSSRAAFGFWVALAGGILLKGPVAPAVLALTIATLAWSAGGDDRARASSWWRDLRAGPGIVLLAVLVAPWAIAIGLATDWSFYREALRGDVLPKLLGGHESHGAPPGFHLLLSPVTLWPTSLVVLPGLYAAFRDRRDPAVAFCLAWLCPVWLLFELVPTKLPHYVLPAFPAVALLAARALHAGLHDNAAARRIAGAGWLAVATALAVAAVIAPLALSARPTVLTLCPAIVVLITIALVIRDRRRRRHEQAAWTAVLGGGLALASLFGGALPAIAPLWPSARVAEAVAALAPPGAERPIASVGYAEPSLVFLLGRELRLLEPAETARFFAEHGDALVWVRDDLRDAVESASEAPLQAVAVVEGWNLSKGRRVRLILLERASNVANRRDAADKLLPGV